MPYIPKGERSELDMSRLGSAPAQTPGQLNYLITRLIDQYLLAKGLSYENLNAIVGVLSCAQMELYRRIAAPYEDGAIERNGEVFSGLNSQYDRA